MKNKILTFAFVLFLLVFIHTFVQADDDTTQWADFSNAQYNITFTELTSAKLLISGFSNYTSDNALSYIITSELTDASTLTFENYGSKYSYDSASNTLSLPIAEYVELNQDLYLYISQESESETKILVKGEKLVRPNYPSDYHLFTNNCSAVYDEDGGYHISLTNVAQGYDVTRKATIKLGRISDKDILNSIKNNTSDSWKNLLTFAKADTNSLLNTSSSSDSNLSFRGNTNIKASQLVNEAYYYLYVELDDENGKYYPVEGVTLAQADIYESSGAWFMFFYGDSKFNLSISSDDTSASKTASENTTVDQTTANIKLPFAGNEALIIASIISILAIIGTVSIKKYKDYKGI